MQTPGCLLLGVSLEIVEERYPAAFNVALSPPKVTIYQNNGFLNESYLCEKGALSKRAWAEMDEHAHLVEYL